LLVLSFAAVPDDAVAKASGWCCWCYAQWWFCRSLLYYAAACRFGWCWRTVQSL